MKINNITTNSVVDGEGLRTVIFFQGCSINCPGCHNQHSHDKKKGRAVSPTTLLRLTTEKNFNNKLTLSGGEPLEQNREQLYEFIRIFKAKCKEEHVRPNIWIYSGRHYTYVDITNDELLFKILKECNVLVDGPFIQDKKKEIRYRGSTNQRLIDIKKTLVNKEIVLYKIE